MCKGDAESLSHLMLHSQWGHSLWIRLFREFRLSWAVPEPCNPLLCEKPKYFGGRTIAWCLEDVMCWQYLGCLGGEIGILFRVLGGGCGSFVDKFRFWTSLWTSVSYDFKDWSGHEFLFLFWFCSLWFLLCCFSCV